MKKIMVFFVFILVLSAFSPAKANCIKDTSSYKTDLNIFYYDSSAEPVSENMKSNCLLDIYYPSNKKDFNTVVWFHGGGLTSGSRSIPDELKDKGFAIVAVDYRLSPQVKCPTYLEDAAAAVAWVFKNIKRYGGNPDSVILSGHSAGGYLVMMLGLDKDWLAKYGVDANIIKAVIPFSGQAITHFTIRKERNIPDTQPLIDNFAPLYYVRKDAPPLILITGDRELELLGRYEENAYLKRMMKLAGHKKTELYELDGFDHVEMVKPAYNLLLKYLNHRQ